MLDQKKYEETCSAIGIESNRPSFQLFKTSGFVILERVLTELGISKDAHAFFLTKDGRVVKFGLAFVMSCITQKVDTHDIVFLVLFER